MGVFGSFKLGLGVLGCFLNVLIKFLVFLWFFGVTGYLGFGCTQNFGGCFWLVCGPLSLNTRLDLLSLLKRPTLFRCTDHRNLLVCIDGCFDF